MVLSQQDAEQLCREAGWPVNPRRALDTVHNNSPCWVINAEADNAIVVYDDDAKTNVSTGNHPGRFIEEKSSKAA